MAVTGCCTLTGCFISCYLEAQKTQYRAPGSYLDDLSFAAVRGAALGATWIISIPLASTAYIAVKLEKILKD